jgi:hypothetical protein
MWRLSGWVVRSALTLMMCGVAGSALGQEAAATKGSADRTSQESTKEGKTGDQATTPDDEKAKLELGVTVVADFYFNTARPVGPGVPFYLSPASPFGLSQVTFDANARATMLSARLSGVKVGNFDLSARVQAFLFDPVVINDKYGILPFAAVVQLKNEDWLFSTGLQLQIFNPLFPNMMTWSRLGGSGNAGAGVIGQARVERYLQPSEKSQVTLTAGISEPTATTFSDVGHEDNGWPNVEGRATVALGSLKGEGPAAKRPFEVSISGVVGQIRTTAASEGNQVVTDMWGLGSDFQWSATPRLGFLGEAFVGRTLGIWTGGILQTKNPTTFEGIHASGGWIEGYYYFRPDKLHTHLGYGIDNPRDEDLAPGQKTRNETYFGNLVLDVTRQYRLGWELTYRKTLFIPLGDGTLLDLNNEGLGVQMHVEYRF